LHSFNGTDGESPQAALVEGLDGKFYGTTVYGGVATSCTSPNGCGTIFTIVPDGTPVTLYDLCSQADCADGYFPYASLVQGTDGNFYGTTAESAYPDFCFSTPCGTVFKITPSGTLTTLYAFNGSSESNPAPPYGPMAGLVQGTDGNFYGTTAYGGNGGCGYGSPGYCGTIFKITPDGVLTTL
jgi:uncharacterized repeat protein (TIGR03803 family)